MQKGMRTWRYQHGWPRRVTLWSMISSATRKKACNLGILCQLGSVRAIFRYKSGWSVSYAPTRRTILEQRLSGTLPQTKPSPEGSRRCLRQTFHDSTCLHLVSMTHTQYCTTHLLECYGTDSRIKSASIKYEEHILAQVQTRHALNR